MRGKNIEFSAQGGKAILFMHGKKIIEFSVQGGKAKEGGGVDTKEIMKRRRERAICIVSNIIINYHHLYHDMKLILLVSGPCVENSFSLHLCFTQHHVLARLQ